MAENHPHNLGFKEESIVVQHAIFVVLVETLINQIKVKYQSMPVSPFETHKGVMSAFFVALFIYATASVAEVILRTQKSVHQRLVGNIRLFASALATTLLLMTLALVLACIISVLWICLSVKLAYESCQDLCQLLSRAAEKLLEMLKGLIAIAEQQERNGGSDDSPNPPCTSFLCLWNRLGLLKSYWNRLGSTLHDLVVGGRDWLIAGVYPVAEPATRD
ncbi:RPB1A [Salix purpurea]|uniref:RPB1A n=1 Tax=Salix purpurea TaxID=77065 RepID=A0A9Q0SIW7_SALPP|nr:RPB1A [Salix purpurea]